MLPMVASHLFWAFSLFLVVVFLVELGLELGFIANLAKEIYNVSFFFFFVNKMDNGGLSNGIIVRCEIY